MKFFGKAIKILAATLIIALLNVNTAAADALDDCREILLSGTYTISGDASQNPDYQTINAAATAVASQGVNGDVTFEIAPGTYSVYVTLNSIAGVSDDARVTFKGMGADNTGVVITSNAGYTSNSTLKLDGPDFVTFENMTIQSTSENNAIVVDLCGGLEGDVFQKVRFIGAVSETSNTDNNKNTAK